MTDRENLPAVSNQQVAVHTGQRGSLVMRGLVAVQKNKALALMKVPEQGNANSQYSLDLMYDNRLGLMYAQNYGVFQNDQEAAEGFRKAAEQEDADAQFGLAWMYYFHADPDGDEEAAEWYRKAAEQGHAQAQFELGEMYYLGIGVEQNFTQAVFWISKAAEQSGHGGVIGLRGGPEDCHDAAECDAQWRASALWRLGWMYEHGQGVPQDFIQAAEWHRKAAAQGPEGAQQLLDECGIDGRKQDAPINNFDRQTQEIATKALESLENPNQRNAFQGLNKLTPESRQRVVHKLAETLAKTAMARYKEKTNKETP